MKRLLCLLGMMLGLGLAGTASAAPAAIPACAAGQVIKFAGVNWESGEFITAVMREMVERGYGCHTEAVPGNTVTLEQALADDDIQVLAEEWVSRSDVWNAAAKAGTVRAVGHPFTDASEGWYVPDYLVHGDAARGIKPLAPNLNAVSQLNDPIYLALFRDPEQPDKGRFLNCPSGWTCEGVNSAKLQAYGLTQAYVDFRPGTGPALDAAITSAYDQGLPVLFYYWSPSPIAGKLKLLRLTEPPYSDLCWKDLTKKDGQHSQGCTAPPADLAYGLSSRFAESAPEIAAMLAKATFPMNDLNANLVNLSGGKVSAHDQAILFLKTRPDLWRAWVPAEVGDRIAAGLGVTVTAKSNFPAGLTVSIRQPVNDAIASLVRDHGAAFRAVSNGLLAVVVALDKVLDAVPWWLLILAFMGLAWWGTRKVSLTAAVGGLMFVVGGA